MIGGIVYLLCFATSTACAVLLWRGWRRSGVRLLLWTFLCFVGLALNNLLLVVDMLVVPEADLTLIRNLPALAGILILLVGMIWDSR